MKIIHPHNTRITKYVMAFLLFIMFSFSCPIQAKAVELDTDANIEKCMTDSGYEKEEIASQVIFCMRSIIIQSTTTLMQVISDFMSDILTILIALTVAFFGIRLVAGETEVTSKTVVLALKIALVGFYGYNLGNLADYPIAVLDEMASLATPFPGWTPWQQIDAFMGRLFGFAPDLTLGNGVIGVILASALSATTGFTMFSSGLLAFFNLMLFVLDIIYAYLSAVLVVSFMMIISPIFIPLVLFQSTERFFKKWLNVMIGGIIMPMILFAILSISLNIFDNLVDKTIADITDGKVDAAGNPSLEELWRMNIPSNSWGSVTDSNRIVDMSDNMTSSPKSEDQEDSQALAPVNSEINPNLRYSTDLKIANMFGVEFEPIKFRKAVLDFITLWVYSKLLLELVRKAPQIAQSITASVLIPVGNTDFKQLTQSAKHNAGVGAGALMGGAIGGKIGGIGGPNARSAGTIAGVIIGGSQGPRLLDEGLSNMGSAINKQLSELVKRR